MERLVFDPGATDQDTSFARLLRPLDEGRFFKEHWDAQPFFADGGGRSRFDVVMNHSDFVSALFNAKLGSPNLRYLQKSLGDRQESLDFFLRKKANWTEPQSLGQLAEQLPGGTLVFVAIENAVPSAKSYCRSLFADLKCQMSINAYFSAGRDASAFDAHFDSQDVFILQLEGEKEWRLWERERVPNAISGFPDAKSIPQPQLPADESVILTAGDLLYVPRGMWHWPRSLDNHPSLHLTLTLVMPKPIDVIHWLTELMSEEEDFRSALPFSQHQDGAAVIGESLERVMAFLSQKLAAPEAKTMATAYMMRESARSVMQKTSSAVGEDKEL
ncbi:MAG: cupin domain-containing protein [Pontixanthobacter sp.]